MHQDDARKWLAEQKEHAASLRDQSGFDSSLVILSMTIEVLSPHAEELEMQQELGWLHAGRGYILGELQGRFLEARKAYMLADACFSKAGIQDFQVGRYVYEPLGNIYVRLGDNEQAQRYLQRFLSLSLASGATVAVADACNDLAMVSLEAGDAAAGRNYLRQGLLLDSISPINRLLLMSNMARSFVMEEDWEQAVVWGERTLDAVPAKNFKFSWQQETVTDYTAGTLIVLMQAQARLGNAPEVEKLVTRSRELLESPGKALQVRKQAKVLISCGEAFLALGQVEQAESHYSMALSRLMPEYDASADGPPSFTLLYAEPLIGLALMGRLEVQVQVQNQTLADDFVGLQLAYFDCLFELEAKVRSELLSEAARLAHSARYAELGQRAASFAFEVYAETGTDSLLWKALAYAEASKAILLSESLNRNLLSHEAVPQKRLSEILDLRQQIAVALVDGTKQEGGDLVKLHQQEAQLKDSLAEEFPELYDRWYRSNLLSVSALKTWAQNRNGAVLSAFVAEERLLLFCAASGKLMGTSTSYSASLVDSLEAFSRMQRAPLTATPGAFQQLGFGLYQRLLKPFMAQFPEVNAWTFVPDGSLNGLNLELLCSSAGAKNSFRELPYLIHQHAFSYAPSIGFLTKPHLNENFKYTVLNIHPSFDCNDLYETLPSIDFPFSVWCFSSSELKDGQANLKQLHQQGSKAQVLHFSTHGSAADTSDEPAWIALADSSDCTHRRLYFPELQAASLHAELAVVQACQSGSGSYRKGAGVLSVAHSLAHAGCENVIASTWDANPETTGRILEQFYTELWQQGNPAEGLRQAKLDFLASETADEHSMHPYYWSGLVLTGNGSFSVNPPLHPFLPMLFCSLVLFAVGLLFAQIFRGKIH